MRHYKSDKDIEVTGYTVPEAQILRYQQRYEQTSHLGQFPITDAERELEAVYILYRPETPANNPHSKQTTSIPLC